MPETLSETITYADGTIVDVRRGRSTMVFIADIEPEVSDIVFYGGDVVSYDGAAVTYS